MKKKFLVENGGHLIHASIEKFVSMIKTVDLGSENWSISEQVPSEAWLIFITTKSNENDPISPDLTSF